MLLINLFDIIKTQNYYIVINKNIRFGQKILFIDNNDNVAPQRKLIGIGPNVWKNEK